ncbi:MAG TPA: DNA primase catalytic subunit PriS [Methanocorpusculum sp.]|nr:DNA primase catalytic subunit PriS [Methanocorpusculum sp.]HJJ40242.1 DNA primase catalytic subunit PriS [Methanocorpusculum sp.]HJJ49631.1 DNA primase catalytic subunit PriS [Methanocorpusculum sp.]HJJ57775.1 DNA primase catalytic subunit PriS [Methanocorpusculum sp.]
MKPATLEFVRKRFAAYYNGEIKGAGALFAPSSMTQREWGFLFFSTDAKVGMRRHLDFRDLDSLKSYLKTMTPAHVYYSTAYYRNPSAGTMAEKTWQGADLIFDLDADHILHASYEVMLSRVKEELFKLIDMLTGELGFDKKDLHINFSGGRGYHIHLPLLTVRSMDTAARRQLADYVSGVGLTAESMLASPQKTGWPVRWRSALSAELERISGLTQPETRAYLCGFQGVSERQADLFYKGINDVRRKLNETPSLLKENKIIAAMTTHENPVFQEKIQAQAALVDEPVTADVKRLIRYPGSLHGGSGMQAVSVDVSDLDTFDPLVDPVVFGEDLVTVTCQFPVKMPMLGNTYNLVKGTNKVPEALAIFLCCRGIAELGGEN